MAKIGRPQTLSNEERKLLLNKLEAYIDKNTIPILAEFAYMNNVTRQSMYDWTEFSTLIKRCTDKKETNLEKGVLSGKLNASMGIFSLKQLGWRDRQEIDHTTDGEKINDINITVKGSKSKLLDKK